MTSLPARRLLRELDHPRQAFSMITPNWFASVMGTGIVANAAATLPLQFPGLRVAATAVWILASVLLVVVSAATITHWITHRSTARGHLRNPVMAHFYGAPPMALLTVGAGTLQFGPPLLGESASVAIALGLWITGTVLGVACAVIVLYVVFTVHDMDERAAFGGWLMPVVPPMVAASTGAALIPHIPEGEARLTMMLGCYAMFGLTLLVSLFIIAQLWTRLTRHGIGAPAAVPTLWIVLGPLGQSITAATALGAQAHLVVDAPLAGALSAFGVIYGVPVLGFALLWVLLALAITARTVRSGMPFSLTWWSFTFPVGTLVTGLSGLHLATGAGAFAVMAVVVYIGLVSAWSVVAVRTAHGAIVTGALLRPAAPAPAPTAVPAPAPAANATAIPAPMPAAASHPGTAAAPAAAPADAARATASDTREHSLRV